MNKPVYVTVEFWRDSRDDVVTIEGWLTIGDVGAIFITPSLDFDPEQIRINVPYEKLISIVPAQSVREYTVAGSWEEAMRRHTKSAELFPDMPVPPHPMEKIMTMVEQRVKDRQAGNTDE